MRRCTATFQVTVDRPSQIVAVPLNSRDPSGEIPGVLADSDGNRYEIFAPEGGGSFIGENASLGAGAGAVPNGDIIGLRISKGEPASKKGKTYQRYALGGDWCTISAVDGSVRRVSSYELNGGLDVCVPLPDGFRPNISDLALVAITSDDPLTILSSRVRISTSATKVCGGLNTVPVSVVVGSAGATALLPTAIPETSDQSGLPDTGGTAIRSNGMAFWTLPLGLIASIFWYAVLRAPRRKTRGTL